MCTADDCPEVLEMVEAYVLGALDHADLMRVKKHFEECGGCWECVLSYDPVNEALMLSCEQWTPRSELRSVILTQVINETHEKYAH